MPHRTNLPPTASVAHAADASKLVAPSAERNAEAIRDVLLSRAPQNGQALEIASGTGQHVIAFAQALPGLHWQPSDIDPERLRSIEAWRGEAGLENVAPACALDATRPGWSEEVPPQDLVLCINLLHLISAEEARCVISGAARALKPAGRLFFYGPFLRDGKTTSEGDERFHASLRAQDPAIGYKDLDEVRHWMRNAGLTADAPVEMPANNLCLIGTARNPA